LKLKGRSEINCLAAAEARSKHFPAGAMCIMHSARPPPKCFLMVLLCMLLAGAAAACVARTKSHHEFVIYTTPVNVYVSATATLKGRCFQ
jgi:hypothetical protein